MGTLADPGMRVSRPVSTSTRNTVSESEFMFAHTSHLPSGESEKCRGGCPPHGTISAGEGSPVSCSRAALPILAWLVLVRMFIPTLRRTRTFAGVLRRTDSLVIVELFASMDRAPFVLM